MKKFITILLILTLLISLSACGKKEVKAEQVLIGAKWAYDFTNPHDFMETANKIMIIENVKLVDTIFEKGAPLPDRKYSFDIVKAYNFKPEKMKNVTLAMNGGYVTRKQDYDATRDEYKSPDMGEKQAVEPKGDKAKELLLIKFEDGYFELEENKKYLVIAVDGDNNFNYILWDQMVFNYDEKTETGVSYLTKYKMNPKELSKIKVEPKINVPHFNILGK